MVLLKTLRYSTINEKTNLLVSVPKVLQGKWGVLIIINGKHCKFQIQPKSPSHNSKFTCNKGEGSCQICPPLTICRNTWPGCIQWSLLYSKKTSITTTLYTNLYTGPPGWFSISPGGELQLKAGYLRFYFLNYLIIIPNVCFRVCSYSVDRKKGHRLNPTSSEEACLAALQIQRLNIDT